MCYCDGGVRSGLANICGGPGARRGSSCGKGPVSCPHGGVMIAGCYPSEGAGAAGGLNAEAAAMLSARSRRGCVNRAAGRIVEQEDF